MLNQSLFEVPKLLKELAIVWELLAVYIVALSIVYVVLHRPSAYQSISLSRMWAGGLVLTDYQPYSFLHKEVAF